MVDEVTAVMAPKRSRRWWILPLLVIIVATLGGGLCLHRWVWVLPIEGQSFNVLLMGKDVNYSENGARINGPVRTDSIMVMIVPRQGPATFISIPRDTLVRLTARTQQRINSAYAVGGNDLAVQVVSDLMGIKIDRYITVGFDGFVEFIDALGGVTIKVDKKMQYTDRAGGLFIDLAPGEQVLDGKNALDYVRYRYDALGDIARVHRQQQFILAVLDAVTSWRGVRRMRSLVGIVAKSTETNISPREILALGLRLYRSRASTATLTLPGSFNGAYWQPDRAAIKAAVDTAVRPR